MEQFKTLVLLPLFKLTSKLEVNINCTERVCLPPDTVGTFTYMFYTYQFYVCFVKVVKGRKDTNKELNNTGS